MFSPFYFSLSFFRICFSPHLTIELCQRLNFNENNSIVENSLAEEIVCRSHFRQHQITRKMFLKLKSDFLFFHSYSFPFQIFLFRHCVVVLNCLISNAHCCSCHFKTWISENDSVCESHSNVRSVYISIETMRITMLLTKREFTRREGTTEGKRKKKFKKKCCAIYFQLSENGEECQWIRRGIFAWFFFSFPSILSCFGWNCFLGFGKAIACHHHHHADGHLSIYISTLFVEDGETDGKQFTVTNISSFVVCFWSTHRKHSKHKVWACKVKASDARKDNTEC